MPDRPNFPRGANRGVTLTIDVVLFTPRDNELAVLLVPVERIQGRGREGWALPSDVLRRGESLDEAADRIVRGAAGVPATFLDQTAALGGSRGHGEAGAQVAIAYFGLVPNASIDAHPNGVWIGLSELPPVGVRHRREIEVALTAMRTRVDQQPIAFRLLPPAFTLSELQGIYELLLGRKLHKASFRRSLHASSLVEATDEWRSEGRGRPAQFFRYAPARRRRQRRGSGIRFDLLSP